MISTTTPDLRDLRQDGDTIDLGDGRILRLVVQPDHDASINDSDTYGMISDYQDYSQSAACDDYGRRSGRPHGFTGNAEKLQADRGYVWWEPYRDIKRGAPEFAEMRDQVIRLLEEGFYGVSLELLQGEDAYHQPIVVDVADLWGIDGLDSGYLAEVINDLASELGL